MTRYGRQVPVGMGGWLAVFVVTLGLNAAVSLVVVGLLADDLLKATGPMADPRMHRYLIAAAALGLWRSAGYAFLVWRLIGSRSRWTPRLAIAGIWLIGPGLWLAEGATLSRAAIGPFVYAAVWTAYLLRSDRVASTYAPRGADLAAVFG